MHETLRLLPNALTCSCLHLMPRESLIDIAFIPTQSIDRLSLLNSFTERVSVLSKSTSKCIPDDSGSKMENHRSVNLSTINLLFKHRFCEIEIEIVKHDWNANGVREPDFQSYRVLHFSEISYRPDRAHSPLKSPSFIQRNRFPRSKKRKKNCCTTSTQITTCANSRIFVARCATLASLLLLRKQPKVRATRVYLSSD